MMAEQTTESNPDWTIGRLLEWTRQHFQTRGIEDARLCAELLLAKALDCPKIELYARFGDSPSEGHRAAFRELVQAAAAHRPIAYLVGHKEFYSLDFIVSPAVLIPRPETELLVEHALAWCRAHPQARYDLLEIGTGSGCVAVTVAKRDPRVHVLATDISEPALAVARQNADRHGVSDRIALLRADMLDLPAEARLEGGFDLILSNPPYVAEQERDRLPENVREYEPAEALFMRDGAGGGDGAPAPTRSFIGDGLDAFRCIAEGVRGCLRPGGTLLLEIGEGQVDAVTAFCRDAGLEPVARHRDLSGTERALQFTLPA